MQEVFGYAGDVDFFPGGPIYPNPKESSLFLSLGHHVDVYFTPRKRSRVTAPFVFSEEIFEQKRQPPSIEVLPDECLFEVFRRLPGGQERSACASVSKRWLMLLSTIRKEEICAKKSEDEVQVEGDGYLTRCLEGKKATDVGLAAVSVGTCTRGGLGKLSIRGSNPSRGVTDLGLKAIAHGCPSLRALSLWNVPSVGDEGVCEIANGCHMLEKLDLSHCPSISDKALEAIAKSCPNLISLTLESCPNIGNGSLQAVGRYCPNLMSISIKNCPLVSDQGIASLLSSASLVLTKVKLSGLNISDISLAVIGHYGKAITDLSLISLHNLSEKGFWVMGNGQGLQHLRSFSIVSCQGVTDLGLEALGRGCPNLKLFCLRKSALLSDNGLASFAKTAISLESLILEECHRITQSGFFGVIVNCSGNLKSLAIANCMGIKDLALGHQLMSVCSSLRSLSVRNCPGFGNSSLTILSKLCPQIQNLDLVGLGGITDDGFLPLVQSSDYGFVKVNLSGCLNLTDASVSAIATLHSSSLEQLNLDGCRYITDSSLASIAENCLFLNELDVSKTGITDSGIAALAGAEQVNLLVLSMSGCSLVSDMGLPYLQKLGKTLVGLNIQQCHGISSNSIDLLVERLWRCDILF